MIYGIKFVMNYLLGRDIAGRNLAVFPDDTFIVSYPRSGNTWTRFLIANLLHPEPPVTFSSIEQVIPDTSSLSSKTLKRVPRPRILKSHEYFDPRYQKVIYLVRDPRDVAISLYHFRRKYRTIDDGYPLERYVLERFLPGDMDASWGEHVGSWLGARRSDPRFLLVRYEDLLENPVGQLQRMAHFLGIDASADRLALAVECGAADRLRKLEKIESEKWVTTRGKRQDVAFIGSAKSGGWRSNLPDVSVQQIEVAWGDLMKSLGYELSERVRTVREPDLATALEGREV
jgi:hypothetical protein